jgi:hypothetical protein
MKKKFFSIAKKHNVKILEYSSKRSDMGVQMFKMKIENENGTTWYHEDGYYVGESNGREKLLDYFDKYLLQELIV